MRAQHVATPAGATSEADAVLLPVHWTRMDDVLAQAGTLSAKVLLTCSVAAKVPGAHVVSAFSTVPSEALLPIFERLSKGSPPDLLYCGDHKGARKTATSLTHDVGFKPADVRRCPRPAM